MSYNLSDKVEDELLDGREDTGRVEGRGEAGCDWKAVEGVTAAEKAAMRFFKVVVVVQ